MRIIGLDIHRAFAAELSPSDIVVIEATGHVLGRVVAHSTSWTKANFEVLSITT